MGTIYSRSGATFVWLGKADGQTSKALSMVTEIAQTVAKHLGNPPDAKRLVLYQIQIFKLKRLRIGLLEVAEVD